VLAGCFFLLFSRGVKVVLVLRSGLNIIWGLIFSSGGVSGFLFLFLYFTFFFTVFSLGFSVSWGRLLRIRGLPPGFLFFIKLYFILTLSCFFWGFLLLLLAILIILSLSYFQLWEGQQSLLLFPAGEAISLLWVNFFFASSSFFCRGFSYFGAWGFRGLGFIY